MLTKETPAGHQARMARVQRLPAKDLQALNLAHDWLNVFLPHCLAKIDRVTFGVMTDNQVRSLRPFLGWC